MYLFFTKAYGIEHPNIITSFYREGIKQKEDEGETDKDLKPFLSTPSSELFPKSAVSYNHMELRTAPVTKFTFSHILYTYMV